MTTDVLMVYVTFPDEPSAAKVARAVVDERLVACVNLIPQVRSFYRWEGKVNDDPELLAIMKTTRARFDALSARVVELHPYDCPEVLAVSAERGFSGYLEWVAEETTTGERSGV